MEKIMMSDSYIKYKVGMKMRRATRAGARQLRIPCIRWLIIGLVGLTIGISSCDEGAGGDTAMCRVNRTIQNNNIIDTYTLRSGGNSAEFKMIAVPVGNGIRFFTGTNDDSEATVDSAYSIAETELTYAVWKIVYDWATSTARGDATYDFDNPGRQGGNSGSGAVGNAQHPVTTINWYDSVKFANALTEFCASANISPVYKNGAVVMRGGTVAPTVDANANGFRIPTYNEWELAARYINDTNNDGDIRDNNEYYPGNYASGASANVTNTTASQQVAWFSSNANNMTHAVRGRSANALGLHDVSGNVWEWVFDNYFNSRRSRGGAWSTSNSSLRVGSANDAANATSANSSVGLRLVK